MPINRNALVRYRTIDKCLQNRFRTWTLEDLMDACSDVLYEYEGIDKGVSRRTIQMDLQVMRGDKLGYNAPIVVKDRKYYTYEDPDYSITNSPLNDQDLNKLNEVVQILEQFKGFSHFQEVETMIQKLEDKIYTERTHQESVIEFEKNEALTGLEHLNPIYRAILNKQTLALTYQPFHHDNPAELYVHPYLLKEYRNRWFLLGNNAEKQRITIFALDRIKALSYSAKDYEVNPQFDSEMLFKNTIGVTVVGKPYDVRLLVAHREAQYLITKPLHPSQVVEATREDGVIFLLKVQLNFELEREILGMGEAVTVLGPATLKQSIRKRLQQSLGLYVSE